MLVVDVLHEWEVGIWRQIFTHLVRILDTFKQSRDNRVHELNRRFAVTIYSSTYANYYQG